MDVGKKSIGILRKYFLLKALKVSTLAFVLLLGSVILVQSATISGIVYGDNGNPITDIATISVKAHDGNPCGTVYNQVFGTFNPIDGTFEVEAPTGYYLLAQDTSGKYLLEWWTPDGSTPKCGEAVPVSEATGSKDFQLSIPGDVNRDGDISLHDAIITLQNLTGQTSNRVWLSGDVNNDNRISIPEAIYILKESAQ